MIFRTFSLLLFLAFSLQISAQDKQISLEEIWTGAFQQEGLPALQSLKDGQSYILQTYDDEKSEMRVDIFSYKTGERTGTLINAGDIDELEYFQSFKLNADESKAILGVEVEPIFRRSAKGIYFVYDLKTKELTPIDPDKIQEPTFSPNNTKVAYVKENNIYIKDLTSGEQTQITSDGLDNHIINGLTDWVYEEEFAFVRAFEWSLDGEKIAFLKFDETDVPEFSMDMYGRYGEDLYPSQDVFKYPKAGEKNADVSLHVYDLASQKTNAISLEAYEYLPRLKWTKDKDVFSVQATNRHQNELKLYFVNTQSNKAELVHTESDAAYVDVADDLTFLDDNSFIWTSEKDGWKHIYHYDKNGDLINQVTKGDWEVTSYYGYDTQQKRIFYQSTETGSLNRGVYSIKLNGRSKRDLSTKTGTNSASFSADFTYYVNTFNSVESPNLYTLNSAKKGSVVREIKNNKALEDKLNEYQISSKELSTIAVNGYDLNMWMIKPTDFDASKKYPVLMYQYSGPGSQTVSNSFMGSNDYWYQLLANKGYIVVAVDGRGTGFKGRDFKKLTQKELGKLELQDQIDAAKLLGKRQYIDRERIGIWGWSYGGFMSSNAIFQAGDVFSFSIAVAPVTSWRFYDSIYTERYMTTPQENASGYDQNSPITHVSEFDDSNSFLLIHGTADDNVHVQNSMQLIEALVQANKQFDWRLYPDKNHGIYGGNTRLHLYRLMTDFITDNL